MWPWPLLPELITTFRIAGGENDGTLGKVRGEHSLTPRSNRGPTEATSGHRPCSQALPCCFSSKEGVVTGFSSWDTWSFLNLRDSRLSLSPLFGIFPNLVIKGHLGWGAPPLITTHDEDSTTDAAVGS